MQEKVSFLLFLMADKFLVERKASIQIWNNFTILMG